eukprot:Blabericola_migrator_1__12547@NODE_797_length_6473_cov_6_762722_g565_i0_p1_GENE_NODE_797_length_6473_cov_6_762722_g565_i0NODE_797_length_6473_cov_6_762722_g565_i0_p1_ORF_typecomplete_len1002_score186_28ATG16/PF08614_11/1_8e04ATG16/PF08614_11/3_2e03ATG16/PF08614_11/0_00019ATG16/PF08614_11/0_31ATG16/PF08614_11/1_2ATG16/PF08614_11/2_4e03DUF3584/PF12128_8/2_4e03DUF3584/PF12128_8/0_00084DUF3584/PF12128_8/2_3e03DUF812/PF05667_11/0_0009DUF812/PF05667_11/2_2e02CALCOCO1/PF07888_11/7_1e03CALCOCO1/PF07888_
MEGEYQPSPRFGTSEDDGGNAQMPPFMKNMNPMFSQIADQIGSLSTPPTESSFWSRGFARNRHLFNAQKNQLSSNSTSRSADSDNASTPSTPTTASGWQARSEGFSDIHPLAAWDSQQNSQDVSQQSQTDSQEEALEDNQDPAVHENSSQTSSPASNTSSQNPSETSSPASSVASPNLESEASSDTSVDEDIDSSDNPFQLSREGAEDNGRPHRPTFRFGWWEAAENRFNELQQETTQSSAPAVSTSKSSSSLASADPSAILSSSEAYAFSSSSSSLKAPRGKTRAVTLILEEFKRTVAEKGPESAEALELLDTVSLIMGPTHVRSTTSGSVSRELTSSSVQTGEPETSGAETSSNSMEASNFTDTHTMTTDSRLTTSSTDNTTKLSADSQSQHGRKKKKKRRKSLEVICETLKVLLSHQQAGSGEQPVRTMGPTTTTDSSSSHISSGHFPLTGDVTAPDAFDKEFQTMRQRVAELQVQVQILADERNELRDLTVAQGKHLEASGATLEKLEAERHTLSDTVEKMRAADIRRGEFIVQLQNQVSRLTDEKQGLKIILQENEQRRKEIELELNQLHSRLAASEEKDQQVVTLSRQCEHLQSELEKLQSLNTQYEADVKDIIKCCKKYRTEAKSSEREKLEYARRCALLQEELQKLEMLARAAQPKKEERKPLAVTELQNLEEILPSRVGLSRSVQAGQSFSAYEGPAALNGSLAELEALKARVMALQDERQHLKEVLYLTREEKRLLKVENVRMTAQLEERNMKIDQLEFMLKCEVELQRRDGVSRVESYTHQGEPLTANRIPFTPTSIKDSEVLKDIRRQNKKISEAFDECSKEAKQMTAPSVKTSESVPATECVMNLECPLRSRESSPTKDPEASMETAEGSIATASNDALGESSTEQMMSSVETIEPSIGPQLLPPQRVRVPRPSAFRGVPLHQIIPTHHPFCRTVDMHRMNREAAGAYAAELTGPQGPGHLGSPHFRLAGISTPNFGSVAGSREVSRE